MTIHAKCNQCGLSNPGDCASWNIIEQNEDQELTLTANHQCQADNWITNGSIITPQNQPPEICMHNTDQFDPSLNDKEWKLFSVNGLGPFRFPRCAISFIVIFVSIQMGVVMYHHNQ